MAGLRRVRPECTFIRRKTANDGNEAFDTAFAAWEKHGY